VLGTYFSGFRWRRCKTSNPAQKGVEMTRRQNAVNCWALFFVLIVTAGALDNSITPMGIAEGYLVSSNGGTPSMEAVVHAAGEFRLVVANLLWMKVVDHYHHQFLAKGGEWNHNTALMPYLRMIVWLDPHFIEAYEVGGSILAATHRYKDADDYLGQGTRSNTDSWQLYYDRAMLRAWYEKNPRAALPFAQHALECSDDSFTRHRIGKFCNTLEHAVLSKQITWAQEPNIKAQEISQ